MRTANERKTAARGRAHHEEDGAIGGEQVSRHGGAARDGPPRSAGQANDAAVTVAHAGNAVQRAVNPSPVVVPKSAQLQTPTDAVITDLIPIPARLLEHVSM